MKVNELTELYELYRSLSKAIPVKNRTSKVEKLPLTVFIMDIIKSYEPV